MSGHIEKMEAQFESWRAEFEALVTRAKKAYEHVDLHRQIDVLKSKHAAARAKLEAAKAAGEGKWERSRVDIWIAWNDLENAFTDFQRTVFGREEGAK